MTCSTGTGCSHSSDCTDHNCPGRSTADDGLDNIGELFVVAIIALALTVIAGTLSYAGLTALWRML